ncbi:hypothetical protein SOVF_174580 [Spinacia oleracea]|nr:hypothetical protein SOVF_174580 [Spinacia oleracea]
MDLDTVSVGSIIFSYSHTALILKLQKYVRPPYIGASISHNDLHISALVAP